MTHVKYNLKIVLRIRLIYCSIKSIQRLNCFYKMVIKHHTEGFEGFWTFMNRFDAGNQVVHVLFEGSIDPVTSQSWCSDCVEVAPIIESKLPLLPEKSHLIIAAVGNREFWKDLQNPFRLDKRLNLMVIPTLLRWQSQQRLNGEQLGNPDLVEMIFTDDIEMDSPTGSSNAISHKSGVSTCGCFDEGS